MAREHSELTFTARGDHFVDMLRPYYLAARRYDLEEHLSFFSDHFLFPFLSGHLSTISTTKARRL
jgi:hypothetical protein